jgi:hypothetical protein
VRRHALWPVSRRTRCGADSGARLGLDLVLRTDPFAALEADHLNTWETGLQALMFDNIHWRVLGHSEESATPRAPVVYRSITVCLPRAAASRPWPALRSPRVRNARLAGLNVVAS